MLDERSAQSLHPAVEIKLDMLLPLMGLSCPIELCCTPQQDETWHHMTCKCAVYSLGLVSMHGTMPDARR